MHIRLSEILREITLKKYICIVLTALIGGGFGLLLSKSMPKQYESTALLETAYIPALKQETSSSAELQPHIEDARYIMARLQVPSSYAPETLAACGVLADAAPGETLAGALIVSRDRNIDTVLKMKIRRSDPELARDCMSAIVNSIKADQDAVIKNMLGVVKQNIASIESELKSQSAEMASQPANVVYMRRFEVINLGNRLVLLNEMKNLIKPARLLSPIYTSPKAVFPPSIHITIPAGLIGGFFFSFLLVVISIVSRSGSVQRP